MDIASDTAHLYDDAKFNDECVRLDVKNQLETKQQNRREAMGLAFTSQILDRQRDLSNKEYKREIRLLKDGLQDIYVKTPYFETFWKLDQDEAKQAVIDRLVGRQKKQRKRDVMTIETVPEHEVINIKQSETGPKRHQYPVRRSKSEPLTTREECSTSSSSRSGHPKRLRSSSLSTFLNLDRHRMTSTSSAESYVLPRIESQFTSNKELLKYDPIVITKPLPKRLAPVSKKEEVVTGHLKTKAHGYVRAAKFHSKSLDRVYFKRSTSHSLGEEDPVDPGLEFSELPDNPVLRAHFISQANSRRIGSNETS